MKTVSSQRPCFQAMPGKLPMCSKPARRCRRIEAMFEASPITATICRNPRRVQASTSASSSAAPMPRPCAPSAT